jgi:hypothetical protein
MHACLVNVPHAVPGMGHAYLAKYSGPLYLRDRIEDSESWTRSKQNKTKKKYVKALVEKGGVVYFYI